MYKLPLIFGLLASSLVMLVITPFLNNSFSNTAMAQEYDKYIDSSTANIQQTITNINVGQVHLKASLSAQ
jgi:O-glycosyl hydrolase